MTAMFSNAAQQAFAAGIATGARRAGVTDAKTIASLQSHLDGEYWADCKQETDPTPAQARQLAGDFTQHYIDHLAGRNTAERLATLRQASWQAERTRQTSNKATDAKFADADAWAKTAWPKMYQTLKNGIGNRPSVARFVLDRHTESGFARRVQDRLRRDPSASASDFLPASKT